LSPPLLPGETMRYNKLKIYHFTTIFGSILMTASLCAAQEISSPELVTIDTGVHHYRASGEYLKAGFPVDAPIVEINIYRAFEIMKYQASVGQYNQCVANNACKKPKKSRYIDDDLPVTGVSYEDA
jgi:formylglycine-generating enzyme required for sulfatase activity